MRKSNASDSKETCSKVAVCAYCGGINSPEVKECQCGCQTLTVVPYMPESGVGCSNLVRDEGTVYLDQAYADGNIEIGGNATEDQSCC